MLFREYRKGALEMNGLKFLQNVGNNFNTFSGAFKIQFLFLL